jgi:hypothetical protein
MKYELSEVAFKQLIDFLPNYNYRNYSPSKLEDKLEELSFNSYYEIEENISSIVFVNEFQVLNYLRTLINKFLPFIQNANYCLEELDYLFLYWDCYNNNHTTVEVYELKPQTSNENELRYIKIYHKILINNCVFCCINHLLNLKNNYANECNISFDEFENLLSSDNNKSMFDVISKLFRNYNKGYLSDSPPNYYYLLKQNLFKTLAKKLIENKNEYKNKNAILQFQTFLHDIENSKFLNKVPNIEKLYSYDSYIKSGLKAVLESDDCILNPRKSGKPELMFISETKKDFDVFFKDKLSESDLLRYDKKREEYIHLFKYEIVSDCYKLIKTLLVEMEEPNKIEKTEIKTNQDEINPSITPIEKYHSYFDGNGYEVFKKCYEKFKDNTNELAYFSAIYRNLEIKKMKYKFGNTKYLEFLKEFSNGKIDIDRVKSYNEIGKNTLSEVLNEIK